MFRDLHYITLDYMCYVQDGWLTFAYWRPPFLKEIKKSAGLDQSFLINSNSDDKNKTFIKSKSFTFIQNLIN
jgi:hypothetical protein